MEVLSVVPPTLVNCERKQTSAGLEKTGIHFVPERVNSKKYMSCVKICLNFSGKFISTGNIMILDGFAPYFYITAKLLVTSASTTALWASFNKRSENAS